MWAKSVVYRAIGNRRWWLWAAAALVVLVMRHSPAHDYVLALFVPLVAIVWYVWGTQIVGLLGRQVYLARNRMGKSARTSSENEEYISTLASFAMIVIVFGGLVVLSKAVEATNSVPRYILGIANAHRLPVDEDLLYVLLPVLAAALISILITALSSLAVKTAIRRWASGSSVPPRDAEHESTAFRLARIEATTREYTWVMVTIVIALIPAMMRADWLTNVVASVAVPMIVVAARLDFARYWTEGEPGTKEDRIEGALARRALADAVPRREHLPMVKETHVRVDPVLRAICQIFVCIAALVALLAASSLVMGHLETVNVGVLLGFLVAIDIALPWTRRERLKVTVH